MKVRIALLMALLVVPLASHAQAFKCRTPSGKMEFSDSPCAGGSQTERIQSNEYISPERQRQAREVQARNAAQVQSMEAENEAYRASIQRQNQRLYQAEVQDQGRRQVQDSVASCVSRVEGTTGLSQRQKADAISRCHGAGISQAGPDLNGSNDCVQKVESMSGLSGRQRANAIARCHGATVPDDPPRAFAPPPEAPKPLAVIKNCNGATCTDQTGQRYTTQAGKTVRSDGKRCYQQGNAMYCD